MAHSSKGILNINGKDVEVTNWRYLKVYPHKSKTPRERLSPYRKPLLPIVIAWGYHTELPEPPPAGMMVITYEIEWKL